MDAETPLVRRAVRTGGVLLAVAAAQFAAVMILVDGHISGFSPWTTSVPSLGATGSSWSAAFDLSLVLLGVLAVFGLLLSWSAFDERPSRGVGLFALLVASVSVTALGAFLLVGSRLPSVAATVAGDLAVVAVGVGLVVVAFAMHQHERWRISRAYTVATGAVVLGAAGLWALHLSFGLGSGGVERLGLGAILVWAIVEGLHIALLHRFAPGLHVKVVTA